MATLSIGVIYHCYAYYPGLLKVMYTSYRNAKHGKMGIGLYFSNEDSKNSSIYHASSSWKPRAFLAIKPFSEFAMDVQGKNKSKNGALDFGKLAI